MHPTLFAVILSAKPQNVNMKVSSEIIALLKKELLLEWKQKYALYGLLMYSLTMVFVISIGLQNTLPPQAWNVVFWVILLFVSVNAIAKSFMSETEGQLLYLYNLASAQSIILAKLIYNCLLMSGIAIVTRQVRGAMIEALSADSVRTHEAKGLPYRTIVWKHALRNSAVIT